MDWEIKYYEISYYPLRDYDQSRTIITDTEEKVLEIIENHSHSWRWFKVTRVCTAIIPFN